MFQSKPIRPAPLTFTFSWQQHKVAIKWYNIQVNWCSKLKLKTLNALLLAREATKAILQILVSEISWQTVIQTQSFVISYISALRSEHLSSAFTCYYYIILFLCCFVVSQFLLFYSSNDFSKSSQFLALEGDFTHPFHQLFTHSRSFYSQWCSISPTSYI